MAGTRRAGELPPLPHAKTAPDPLIGKVIGDRYRIVDVLGTGGMASVYRAEHELLHKPVAIKLLHPDLDKDPQIAPRFEREAIAAARLDHPNCVSITDFGRTPDGRMYLVMEHLEGTSLSTLDLPLDWARAIEITRQVLRGLAHAHEVGILHRDLKPSNIMLVRHGEREVAKLIDFGIAKIIEGSNNGPRVETQAGIVFGTADFIAPERLLGKQDTDPRSDLYAIGVLLFEMLTGERPFHDEDPYVIVRRALTEPARPPSAMASGIPVALDVAVLRALEKDPNARYASARDFLAALDPFGKKPTSAALLTAAARRRPPWAWLATAAAAALVVLIAGLSGSGEKKTATQTPAPAPAADDEVERLVKRAAEGDTPADRASARDRLVALGYVDRVPWVPMLARDLEQLSTCDARREVVAKIRKLKNPEALPHLQKAAQREDNTCLADDARAAMAELAGERAPKPTRRSSGGGHF